MPAAVETMFSVRVKPWHGLGTIVEDCPGSKEAIHLAGLDWKVEQRAVCTDGGLPIPGYKANIRDSDQSILGVVSDRYQVVQNEDAFAFTDELLGHGIQYETAGALQGGTADVYPGKASGTLYYSGGRDHALFRHHEFP